MAERITIVIDTDSAAFDDNPTGEIAEILRDLAKVFSRQGIPGQHLRDSNGNKCGTVTITHKTGEA